MAHSVGDPLIRQVDSRLGAAADDDAIDVANVPTAVASRIFAPLLMFAAFVAAVALAPDLDDAALLAVATIFIGAAFYAARNVAVGSDRSRDSAGASRKPGVRARRRGQGGARPPTTTNRPPAMIAILRACGRSRRWNILQSAQNLEAGADRCARVHAAASTFTAISFRSSNGARTCCGIWATRSRSISTRAASWSTPTSRRATTQIFSTGWTVGDQLLDAYPHDYVLMGVHDQGRRPCQKGPALASDL